MWNITSQNNLLFSGRRAECMYKKKISMCKKHGSQSWCKLFVALASIFIWKRLNVAFCLISGMVLGLRNQLQIFWQFYLIELLGLLTVHGLFEQWRLIYPRLLTGFDMLVFFTNLSLIEFQVRYLALFLLFSVIDDFKWFWMGILHKNIQLILEFLKAPFLVQHFLYYALRPLAFESLFSVNRRI